MIDAQTRKWLRLYGLFHPLSRLPPGLAYRAANAIGRHDFRHMQDARTAIGNGLDAAFPRLAADPVLRSDWIQRYFTMMSREIMDTFVMENLHPGNSRQLVQLDPASLSLMQETKREGRGTILVMAHFGRLNLVLLALAMAGFPLGMLTIAVDERNPELGAVDRRYLSQKVGTLLKHIGGRWVSLGDSMRGLYEGLQAGETIIILMDAHHQDQGGNKLQIPFLDGILEINQGIERIASKTGANLIYGAALENGWRVEAKLRPLPEAPGAALRQAVSYLEQDIQRTPWAWWHWNILDYIWTPRKTETT